MFIRRIVLTIPVLLLFLVTSLVFLAARAPRTWAAHWSNAARVAAGAGAGEYGAARATSGWDLLWFNDDTSRLVFEAAGSADPQPVTGGDIIQPALLRNGRNELGVWIRNRNGRSDLEGAFFHHNRAGRVFRLVDTTQPLEHPSLFRGVHGSFGVVFSWQKHGNFETYYLNVRAGSRGAGAPIRLESAQTYSFYPRAWAVASGAFGLLYLDNCCKQQIWDVIYRSYDGTGKPLAPQHVLYRILGYGQNRQIPDQWGVDIRTDSRGNIWGAFTGDGGVYVFEANTAGRILQPPRLLDTEPGAPSAVAVVPTSTGGVLLWEQTHDLGVYIESRRFDHHLTPVGTSDRANYGAGSQTNLRATLVAGKPEIVWQTVSRAAGSVFEEAGYRDSVEPTIAQRLGLGLGNPWQEIAVLLIGAFGVATLTTTGNLLLVLLLGFAGLVVLRLLRRYPGKWVACACLLTLALYFSFVAPGGPVLFLDTMPSMGLAAMPFGLLACLGALGFVFWMGGVALRRVDDAYRVGIMAFMGVYFFAFVEATVFIQQRLGYI